GAALSGFLSIGAGAAALVAVAWLLPAFHWRAPSLFDPPRPELRSRGVVVRSVADRAVLHDFGSVLAFEGPISLGDARVATVDAPAPGYLFGIAYDQYEGSGWLSSASVLPARQVSPRSGRGGADAP